MPDLIITDGDKKYRAEYDGNYEKNTVVKNQGDKGLLEIVDSGKLTGSVSNETIVSVTISISVQK